MIKGRLVSLEGIDFCGKSLQAKLLSNKIKTEFPERNVRLFREPGDTRVSEKIREILLDPDHMEMDSITELLLYEAARSQLTVEKIRPALAQGDVVICDRFFDSTTAYQGFGRDIDLKIIFEAHKIATQGVVPDKTIVIDISPETAFERKAKTIGHLDRMELEKKEFYHRVRKGYMWLAEKEPARITIVDGERSVDEVFSDIWATVRNVLLS